MASVGYDPKRGTFRVFWNDGLARKSAVVARLPKGTPRPRRDPPEVVRALADYAEREIASRRDRPEGEARQVGRMLDEYERWYASHRAPASLVRLRMARAHLSQLLLGMPLARFGRREAILVLDAIARSGVGPATTRQRVSLLSGAWTWAVRRGAIPSSPWRDLPLPEPSEPGRPSWTPEEYDRLRAAARPWVRDVLHVGVHAGLRVGELVALDWSWVDPKDGRLGSITVPAAVAKSGRSRRIPLHRDLRAFLDARTDREGRILRTTTGRIFRVPGQIHKGVAAACVAAGLPEVGTHAMRRSFGRWAVLGIGPWKGRPVPVYVVSQLLGHRDLKTTQVYLGLDAASADDWMSGDV